MAHPLLNLSAYSSEFSEKQAEEGVARIKLFSSTQEGHGSGQMYLFGSGGRDKDTITKKNNTQKC